MGQTPSSGAYKARKPAVITKQVIALLIANAAYLILFTILFASRKNYEFLLYVVTVTVSMAIVTRLHFKYNFSFGVLLGLSAWGLMHMCGGYIQIGDGVLYGLQLIPKYLRYDQFVHAFGFGYATLFAWCVLAPNLKPDASRRVILGLLLLIGMGFGALNETVEFIAVLSMPETGVGGYDNTMWDMVFNTIGAILAAAYVNIRYFKSVRSAQ